MLLLVLPVGAQEFLGGYPYKDYIRLIDADHPPRFGNDSNTITYSQLQGVRSGIGGGGASAADIAAQISTNKLLTGWTNASGTLLGTAAFTAATAYDVAGIANTVSANTTNFVKDAVANVVTNNTSGNTLGGTFTGSITNSTTYSSDSKGSARIVSPNTSKPIMCANFPYYASWGINNSEGAASIVTNCCAATNIYANINEYILLSIATNRVADGLAALGYVWIDSGPSWAATNRDANGNIRADPVRFPSGMSGLRDILHNMGLKLIWWQGLGNSNSASQTFGSGTDWNFIYKDAAQIGTNGDAVRWDFDSFLPYPDVNDLGKRAIASEWVAALRTNNPSILTFMHNNWGAYTGGWTNKYQSWIGQTVNFWQMTDPLNGTQPDSSLWDNTVHFIDMAAVTAADTGRGHKPAPIPCQAGVLNDGKLSALNGLLFVSEMAMWQSPLVYDRNLIEHNRYYASLTSNPFPARADFQTNNWMIGINQNDDDSPPWKFYKSGTIEVWAKLLKANTMVGKTLAGSLWGDGSVAFLVVNRGYATNVSGTSITIPLTSLGVAPGAFAKMQDVWNYTNVTIAAAGNWATPAITNSAALWVMINPSNNFIAPVGVVVLPSYAITNNQTLATLNGITLNDNPVPNDVGAHGLTSFNWGNSTTASGDRSAVFGHYSTASGLYSFAAGSLAIASGVGSVAFGESTTASGQDSFVIGNSGTASALAAVQLGAGGNAAGIYSTAIGNQAYVDSSAPFSVEINGYGGNAKGTNVTPNSFRAENFTGGIFLLGGAITGNGSGITNLQHAVIQTNFISGKSYVNSYGAAITISGLVSLTVTATAGGFCNLSLRNDAAPVNGGWTNLYAINTTAATIAMNYTNVISLVVPTNSSFTFTNLSTGGLNTATVIGGQITY